MVSSEIFASLDNYMWKLARMPAQLREPVQRRRLCLRADRCALRLARERWRKHALDQRIGRQVDTDHKHLPVTGYAASGSPPPLPVPESTSPNSAHSRPNQPGANVERRAGW